ncbi:MAG: hypothetical protein ACQEQA_05835 [Bacillota bacterium]
MKKLYFGFMVMLTGSIMLAGGLIGGGLVVGGKNAAINYFYDIYDSDTGMFFVVVGTLIFLIGLALSAYYAFTKDEI